VPIAQYVLAAILRIAEDRHPTRGAGASPLKPRKRRNPTTPRQLREQTLLIVGYGRIGRRVARLAKPFGLRSSSRRDQRSEPTVRGGWGRRPRRNAADVLAGLDQLDRLLTDADYVVDAAADAAVARIIGASRSRARRAARWLINVARVPWPTRRLWPTRPRPTHRRCRLNVFERPLRPTAFWDLPNTIDAARLERTDGAGRWRNCSSTTCGGSSPVSLC
jgi:phosphoglycerate dehydrogenase-like enzyme